MVDCQTLHHRLLMEKKANKTLSFLDVKIEQHNSQFLTSICRKPTFTGQYIRWDLFKPSKLKTSIIGSLVHRVFVICFKTKLQQELNFISSA